MHPQRTRALARQRSAHRGHARWLRSLLLAPLTVGGQAVIEGVMMRSPGSLSVAVRRRDGSIVVREQRINNFLSRYRIFRWPLLRGAVMLIESLHNGLSALNFAADQAMLDEQEGDDEPSSPPKDPDPPGADTKKTPAPLGSQALLMSGGGGGTASGQGAIWGTLLLSVVLGLALFVGLPHGLTYLVGMTLRDGLPLDGAAFHLVDGGFKMSIFILYIVLIGRMEDIRRLFAYHGAEHKSVHTFERRLPLEVAEARAMSTAHPRCGTSLVLWVVAISIFMFAAIFPMLPKMFDHVLLNHLAAVLIKIALSLPVAGIAYEAQRAAARHPNSRLVRTLIAPGMWLQSLTTREPDDEAIEVALTALRKVLWREAGEQLDDGPQQVERFANFSEVRLKVA